MKLVIATALFIAAPALGRDVTGTFQTIYWQDNGTTTAVPTPQPAGDPCSDPTACGSGTLGELLVVYALVQDDDAPAHYRRIDGAFSADGTRFRVPGVPDGHYLLAFDYNNFCAAVYGAGYSFPGPACNNYAPQVQGLSFSDQVSSTPDVHTDFWQRPDVLPLNSDVLLDITNLVPFVKVRPAGSLARDAFFVTSSQSGFDEEVLQWGDGASEIPRAGDTSVVVSDFVDGLGAPDASKGDVVYWYQRSTHPPIGTGDAIAGFGTPLRYARFDNLEFTPNGPNSLTARLQDAPQTASLRADVRYARFDAIRQSMAPAGTTSPQLLLFSVLGVTTTSDGRPISGNGVGHMLLFSKDLGSLTGPVPDTDYGVLHYPQFLQEPVWRYYRSGQYSVSVNEAVPGSLPDPFGGFFTANYFSFRPETPGTAHMPIRPRIHPVAVRVNGHNALLAQTAVGLQPELTWSTPGVEDDDDGAPDPAATLSYEVQVLSFYSYSDGVSTYSGIGAPVLDLRTSARAFKIPAGILQPGQAYAAVVTATRRGSHRPASSESIDSVTAPFMP